MSINTQTTARQRFTRGALAFTLFLGLIGGLSLTLADNGIPNPETPKAHAVYGNYVVNHSTGWVHILLDNGRYAWLAGYGSHASNVGWVVVDQGSCVGIGLKVYCAPYGNVQVRLPLAQITVNRIS